MATAITPQQKNGQPPGSPAPLWGEIEIPIVVATGEFGQGKTLLGLTICPGPQTLVMDQEGSSLTYRALDFDHVDMAVELSRRHPKGYTAVDRYQWFREEALRRGREGGRAGRYRVLVIDPASEIEDGLADYVKKNIQQFGLTQAQAERSPALFWGVMKREWKALLDQLRALYETVYITVHLRDEFKGGAPTGKREPKGKETLMELASLSLWLEREKDRAGNVSAVPAATVLKSRLAKTVFADGEVKIVPVLPPRIPAATPKAIRDYIATPPDYDHLKKAERVQDRQLSDDEKLLLQSQIAANQAIAAQAESSRLDKIAMAAKAQTAAHETVRPAPDQAAQMATTKAEQAAASVQPITIEMLTELRGLIGEAFETEEQAREVVPALLSQQGVAKLADLQQHQAEQVKIELLQRKSAEMLRRANAKLISGPAPTDLAPQPIHEAVAHAIREELPSAFATPEECQARFGRMLADFGCQKIAELTDQQGEVVLAALRKLAESRRTAQATGQDQAVATREHLETVKAACERHEFGHEQQTKWLTARGLGSFRSATVAQLNELLTDLNETPF